MSVSMDDIFYFSIVYWTDTWNYQFASLWVNSRQEYLKVSIFEAKALFSICYQDCYECTRDISRKSVVTFMDRLGYHA